MEKDLKRLSRLTAILTHLQTKNLITASELAARFDTSKRTIYRDMKALSDAGVPIVTEDGKGYSIMEGYRIPPVMFTEAEANALITAEQLISKNKDTSFVKEYTNAISKIKSVLKGTTKEKTHLLSKRIVFRQNPANEKTSDYLTPVQSALTDFKIIQLNYHSPETNTTTIRRVEPFALYSTRENWLLIAKCRLRDDYRTFRLDRINHLSVLEERFEPHQLTLDQYFDICRKKSS